MTYKKHLDHTENLPFFECIVPYVTTDCNQRLPDSVGKCYASIVDDEKTAFEQRSKHRQNGHKKSRYLHCSCFCRYGRVAVIYEEILISMWDGSIIQLDKLEFDGDNLL